jgi:hypothetical protein
VKIAHANRTGNDELNVRCDECDKLFTAYELDQAHLDGPAVIHEGCCRNCIEGMTAYGWVVQYGAGESWGKEFSTTTLYARYSDAVEAAGRSPRNVPTTVVPVHREVAS